MEINRVELIKSLEICEDALGDNTEPNEQSRLERQSFRINNNRVYTTNGAIAIETFIPNFNTGIQCMVHGKQLLEFLRSLTSDIIKIEFKEKEIKISSGKVKARFETSPYKEYTTIIDKLHKNPPVKETIEKLIDGLVLCRRFVHTDKTQGVLCGVNIGKCVTKDESGKETTKYMILASDRKRIVKQTINEISIDCTLPLRFINILSKHKPDIYSIQISYEGQELQAFFGNSAAGTVLYGDRYPDMNKYFPADATGSVCILLKEPEEFVKALNRHITVLTDADLAERDTVVTVEGLTLNLTTTGKSIGTVEETFEINDIGSQLEKFTVSNNSKDKTKATKLSFLIDPLLLKQSIKNGFFYYPELKLILFVETTGFKCLLQTRRPI